MKKFSSKKSLSHTLVLYEDNHSKVFYHIYKKISREIKKNIDKQTFFWYNTTVANIKVCMRLYLSWIEGSATNRNAGGSSPSRRARKEQIPLGVCFFVPQRGSNTERARREKKRHRCVRFPSRGAQTGTEAKGLGRQAIKTRERIGPVTSTKEEA